MQLDPRAVVYFMFRRVFLWLFIASWIALVFGPGIGATQPEPGMHWGGLFSYLLRLVPALAVVLGVDALYCYLKVRAYRIELVPQGVALDSGILNKTHEILLFAKIQDILITRSLLERFLGLSTMTIQNASGQPERIPGLAAAGAMRFRDRILERVPH